MTYCGVQLQIKSSAFQTAKYCPNKRPRRTRLVVRAQSEEDQKKVDINNNIARNDNEQLDADMSGLSIDSFNPISLGRRSRLAIAEVWSQFTRITSPTTSLTGEDVGYVPDEFITPEAEQTRILVIGGTGRVGRILIRKLLLRKYRVRALVRSVERAVEAGIPPSVELLEGSIEDYNLLRQASMECDKIVYCAGPRTSFTAEIAMVDLDGVKSAVRSFVDAKFALSSQVRPRKPGGVPWERAKLTLGDFKQEYSQMLWRVVYVGLSQDVQQIQKRMYRGQDRAATEILVEEETERTFFCFTGAVYSKGGIAEAGAPIQGGLAGFEGIVFQVKGDGKIYSLILETEEGYSYSCRFNARLGGFSTIRLPFNIFRAMRMGDPPLDKQKINFIKFRYDRPQQMQATPQRSTPTDLTDTSQNNFNLIIEWIKALPSGEEPDFILVSCAGVSQPNEDPNEVQKRVAFKRQGEIFLRNSGIGYTIIRPGPIVNEPGGYKALVFDQGNRITQSIGAADVADICLRALHDRAAFNKTFEVCYEYTPEDGLQQYELIAHLPDRSNNYLTPALAPLEVNT